MSLPHTFKRITLHLARSHEHPNGSARHGYDIVAPLDTDGRIDPQAWRARRDVCRVRRFWSGEADQVGRLVHRAGGAGGHTWIFDYDPDREDDDEAAFRLGDHVLQIGEYVSIKDDMDEMHTFRVVSVVNAD
ncbi:hypothetical protein ACTZWW_10660 [Salinarimonas sp. NSM]|uniref:hypothetical protein n=1 Tax=Salinarimonas sp. NSM TaxID=3458003 RepID=UPI0040354549